MLLVFISGMTLARPDLLAAGFLILTLLYLLPGAPSPMNAVSMTRRLKWLFLAILIIYGWWTPGTLIWPAAAGWSPSREGLQLGMLRVLVLVAIVAAVQLLMLCTRRERLLPAIMQLISPVTSERLRQRIAVRTLLAIDYVPRVQTMAVNIHSRQAGSGRLSRLARSSRQLYQAVLQQADLAGSGTMEVNELAAPPWWQWLLPVAMSACIIFTTRV